ncbi:hypothetical protein CGLAR1_00890 [Corynebacterium glutamicum]|uniref:DUF1801 domain-containing protein n=1 Tax=Corynebacterium glutamicum TaxID=1718 RepID=UPI0004F7D798|nr:DUF1801 domain-containing protein [Corynebacterium glutamicum]AIK83856.1 hypothetical protein CGLAR1_00890 [Corynebacterium glutamicum]AIK86617.1 hypothetical protein AR0_00885 [Corynebacterium glutamicum]
MSTSFESIPGVTISARRALSAAGFKDLESLAGTNYEEVAGLPGIGARTLERLQAALVEKGMSFSGEIPETEQCTATWTTLDSAAPETTETSESPEHFIQNLDSPRRITHSQLLLEIFNRATGQKPYVAGSSIVGYGRVHYRYATGREGITIRVGFSPRKAKISLYGLTSAPASRELLKKLGKHSVGVSCLYINKPEDVDLEVLEEMIRISWEVEPGEC